MSALGFCFLSEPPVKSLCSSTALCNLTPDDQAELFRETPAREPAARCGYRLRAQFLSAVPMAGWPNEKLAGAPHLALPPPRPPRAGPAPAQCAAPRVVARRTPVPKPNDWPLSRAGASPRGGGSTCRGRERRPQLWRRYFGEATLGRQRTSG